MLCRLPAPDKSRSCLLVSSTEFALQTHACLACCSRPNAVNLSEAARKLSRIATNAASALGADASFVVGIVVAACESMLEEEVLANKVAVRACMYSKHAQAADPQDTCHAGYRQAWGGGFAESNAGQNSDTRQAPPFNTL